MSQLRTYPFAFALLAITLLYNVAEGVIAIASGLRAGSLVLLSFGADSYLEVLAAAAVMWRLSYRDEEAGERAEGKALRFIGLTFLTLAAAVVFPAALALAAREGVTVITDVCPMMFLEPVRGVHRLHRFGCGHAAA